jgi:hypothetical protein
MVLISTTHSRAHPFALGLFAEPLFGVLPLTFSQTKLRAQFKARAPPFPPRAVTHAEAVKAINR